MKKKIAILGSTGSIGRSTLKVIDKNRKNFDICFLISLIKMSQAQIIDSLLAIATDLLFLIASSVGCKPAIPTIAEIV